MNSNLYGNYRTETFTDIWNNVDSFMTDVKGSKIPTKLTDDEISLTFYLLYASYGNSHIASDDEMQFKYKVYSTMFKYGPTWSSRIKIQDELRDLIGTDELFAGSTEIYNHSYNPSTYPSTQTIDELATVDDQNVTKRKRNKLDSYSLLYGMLVTDVTTDYINKFKPLFLQIVQPELPLWYVSDTEDSDYDEETLVI